MMHGGSGDFLDCDSSEAAGNQEGVIQEIFNRTEPNLIKVSLFHESL